MRFSKDHSTGIRWAAAGGALAILSLAGCSEPTSTVSKSTTSTTPQTTLPASYATIPPTPPPTPELVVSAEEAKTAWSEGVRSFDTKEYSSAVEKLQVALTGKSEDPYAHYLLGLALWKSGQVELAEQSLEESARLGDGSLKTWVNLARVRLELGDAQPALEASERALQIDGTSVDALHQKGRALALAGRKDEALETLQAAHESDPENGQVANTLGFWLIQSGNPGDAVAPLESARDRLPSVAYVHNNLAVAYERTGRRDEAVIEYRAAVDCGDSGGKGASSLARLGDAPIPVATSPIAEAMKDPGSN